MYFRLLHWMGRRGPADSSVVTCHCIFVNCSNFTRLAIFHNRVERYSITSRTVFSYVKVVLTARDNQCTVIDPPFSIT